MAKLPNWIECKSTHIKDGQLHTTLKLNYLPLRFIIPIVFKTIGWQAWLYPKAIKFLLDETGIKV